tara:strand:+ start:2912 stop:3478 length:567 start_codon:yes stop_codon:yes gene_type:complete
MSTYKLTGEEIHELIKLLTKEGGVEITQQKAVDEFQEIMNNSSLCFAEICEMSEWRYDSARHSIRVYHPTWEWDKVVTRSNVDEWRTDYLSPIQLLAIAMTMEDVPTVALPALWLYCCLKNIRPHELHPDEHEYRYLCSLLKAELVDSLYKALDSDDDYWHGGDFRWDFRSMARHIFDKPTLFNQPSF